MTGPSANALLTKLLGPLQFIHEPPMGWGLGLEAEAQAKVVSSRGMASITSHST